MSTQAQRDEWWAKQGKGYTSAVGEYTPSEFWTILAEVESKERRISALEIQNTELLDTINNLVKELKAMAHDG